MHPCFWAVHDPTDLTRVGNSEKLVKMALLNTVLAMDVVIVVVYTEWEPLNIWTKVQIDQM